MPRVPEYQPNVSLRPAYGRELEPVATAEAFGAGVGRGMHALGQGIGVFADAVAQVEDLRAKLQAKDAHTAYEREVLNLQYGEGGFFNKEGADAVTTRPAYDAALEELKRKYSSNLKGKAALYFSNAANETETSAIKGGLVHTAKSQKQWFIESSDARLKLLSDKALANYSNPAAVDKLLSDGFREIEATMTSTGKPAEFIEVARKKFASQVHTQVALALASQPGGASRAVEYLKGREDQIDTATRLEIENKLKPFVAEERGQALWADFVGKSTRSFDSPSEVSQGGSGSSNEPSAPASGGREYTVSRGVRDGVTIAGRSGTPTKAKAFLSSRSAHRDRPMDTLGLDDAFAENLAAMIQDAPPEISKGLGIGSAYRTREQQAAAYRNARPGYAAKPGGSFHEKGLAVDLTFNGQRLDKAPKYVQDWVHQNAEKYGLYFPLLPSHRQRFGLGASRIVEEWHIEPMGTRGGSGAQSTVAGTGGYRVKPAYDGVSPRASMPSYADILNRANSISDPMERKAFLDYAEKQMQLMTKARNAEKEEAVANAWAYVSSGGSVYEMPIEWRISMGREAYEGLVEYEKKTDNDESDIMMKYSLIEAAKTDPENFARMNLFDPEIVAGLGRKDFEEVLKLQVDTRSDLTKAKNEGAQVKTAIEIAQPYLKAAGIDPSRGDDDKRAEAAKQYAEFQLALIRRLAEVSAANDGKQLTYDQMTSLISDMLTPVVIKHKGFLWDSEEPAFNFQVKGARGDIGADRSVEVKVSYDKIPESDKALLAAYLEQELGRRPTTAEVELAYAKYLEERNND